MLKIVVLIKVKDVDPFVKFESKASTIMKRYGWEILSAFKSNKIEFSNNEVDEVPILNFPDLPSFNLYKEDPNLADLANFKKGRNCLHNSNCVW